MLESGPLLRLADELGAGGAGAVQGRGGYQQGGGLGYAGQGVKRAAVVVVVMADGHGVQDEDALAPAGLLQQPILVAGVHQYRMALTANKEGIALAHVQHDDLILGGRYGHCRTAGQGHGHGSRERRSHEGLAAGPPEPQPCAETHRERHHGPLSHAYGDAAEGDACQQMRDGQQRFGTSGGQGSCCWGDAGHQQPQGRGGETRHAGQGKERGGHYVRQRSDKGHLGEQGGAVGLGGQR